MNDPEHDLRDNDGEDFGLFGIGLAATCFLLGWIWGEFEILCHKAQFKWDVFCLKIWLRWYRVREWVKKVLFLC